MVLGTALWLAPKLLVLVTVASTGRRMVHPMEDWTVHLLVRLTVVELVLSMVPESVLSMEQVLDMVWEILTVPYLALQRP